MKERDLKLDSLKGFLIILVIIGHLIGKDSSDISCEWCRTFIYTFHMPLFIMISGYLTKNKDNIIDFRNSILSIFVPLCIFQALNLALLFVQSGYVGLSNLIIPYWTLWYLLSLMFWKVIIQFAYKCLLARPILYLSIALLLSIFSGLLPYGRILSVQRTINFFPFFLLGYYIKQKKITPPVMMRNNQISLGIIGIVLVLIISGLYPYNNSILLRGADQYSLPDIPAKIYLLVCSFLVSVSFYNIFKEIKILVSIGYDSLLFYLYHGLIIKFIFQPLIVQLNLPKTLSFMLLYCIIIVITIYGISKIKLLRWLSKPLSIK